MRCASVEHFEKEKLVGIIVDYKIASMIMHLLGYIASSSDTGNIFNSLAAINEIAEGYDTVMINSPKTTAALCNHYEKFLEEEV